MPTKQTTFYTAEHEVERFETQPNIGLVDTF